MRFVTGILALIGLLAVLTHPLMRKGLNALAQLSTVHNPAPVVVASEVRIGSRQSGSIFG